VKPKAGDDDYRTQLFTDHNCTFGLLLGNIRFFFRSYAKARTLFNKFSQIRFLEQMQEHIAKK
jgi:hypothetical protein